MGHWNRAWCQGKLDYFPYSYTSIFLNTRFYIIKLFVLNFLVKLQVIRKKKKKKVQLPTSDNTFLESIMRRTVSLLSVIKIIIC